MKKFTKISSLLIAFTLIGTFAAGCGNSAQKVVSEESTASSQTQTETKAAEPLKFVYHSYHNYKAPDADNVIVKWLKENKNVEVTYESEVLGDKTLDKLNLLAASGGELPDVSSFETYPGVVKTLQRMGEAGNIISMDEWIAKYPGMVKLCDSNYNDIVYKDKKDGKMYFIPANIAAHPDLLMADVGPIIREDWLKQVGMNAPKTTDELYEVLKAFRDKIPPVDGKKIIPATFDVFRQFIADAWTRSWWSLSDDKKALSYQFNNPEIEGYMLYMNKLYRENLLDPEFITQQADAYMSKLSSGRAGFTVRIYWDMDKVNGVLKEKDPQNRFIPSPPIRVADKGFVPIYANPSNRAFSAVVVSAKFAENNANLERLMEFLNWTTGDEAVMLTKYGPEGMYYTKNGQGQMEIKPEFKADKDNPNSTFYQKSGLRFYNLLDMYIIPDPEASPRTEEAMMGNTVWSEALQPMPVELELPSAGPIEQQKWGAMWTELDKWTAKAVFAKSEDECRKITQEMLKAFETNGGSDIVNERLKSIQDFIAQNQ